VKTESLILITSKTSSSLSIFISKVYVMVNNKLAQLNEFLDIKY